MRNEIFPTTDAGFNDYLFIVVPYLQADASRFLISTGNLSNLNTYYTQWEITYPNSQNADKRTTAITTSKNIQKRMFKLLLRKIYRDISFSILTEDDRATLNLKKRDLVPTAAPIPANPPILAFVKKDYLIAKISIKDPQNPDGRKKPEGVFETEIQSAILKKGTVIPIGFPSDEYYRHILSTGKHLFVLTYLDTQIGDTIYYRARYINTRKQFGPWSPFISWIVS